MKLVYCDKHRVMTFSRLSSSTLAAEGALGEGALFGEQILGAQSSPHWSTHALCCCRPPNTSYDDPECDHLLCFQRSD